MSATIMTGCQLILAIAGCTYQKANKLTKKPSALVFIFHNNIAKDDYYWYIYIINYR
ncbi:hypothetical protein D3C85_1889320 [compost metagenome]